MPPVSAATATGLVASTCGAFDQAIGEPDEAERDQEPADQVDVSGVLGVLRFRDVPPRQRDDRRGDREIDREISLQDTAWTAHPPTKGPSAVATPDRPDHAPIALLRSLGTNVACRMATLPGISRAAPTPCNARAAMRIGALGAIPQRREVTANQTTPMTKTHRRPYRSPSAPATRSRPARVRV
jgi:hypothetical protein